MTKKIGVDFHGVWEIGRVWSREELIKFRKVRVKIGIRASASNQ